MAFSHLIPGKSSAAELIRTMDWSTTVLGPLDSWSEVLVSTVNTLLAAPVPMQLFWGTDCICIYNDAMTPALNSKHPHAMGRPAREVWHEVWHTIGPQLDAVLHTGDCVYEEELFLPLLVNGVLQDHYWTYSYSPVYGRGQVIAGVLDVAQDVTTSVQAKQAEAARRESEARLRAFVLATNNALYQMSADWSVMYQLNGSDFLHDTETAEANWLTKYIHPLDQEMVLTAIRGAIESKKVFELEHRVLRADGSLGWTFSRAIPILGEHGQLQHWFGAATDVTERKLIERALIQREKLAAVGQLASTIAHEINNPLEAVTNLLFLAEQNAVHPDVKTWLLQADGELKRVAAITNKTLRFHRQSTKPQAVLCSSLFASTLDLYTARFRNSRISVQNEHQSDVPLVCFEGDIRQVLSNLVANAIDAMPNGGRLVVMSRVGMDWCAERRGMFLSVADTGTGMDEETYHRALDAFYTTKGINGSGLGLWISRQIMDRHKGRISIRSSQKPSRHGTVVRLFIPFDASSHST